jgi:hypothetical protein
MPIGTSKVGALGGLVPGGTETFNASGTFAVPPGVKKVSITGTGGSGSPGTGKFWECRQCWRWRSWRSRWC